MTRPFPFGVPMRCLRLEQVGERRWNAVFGVYGGGFTALNVGRSITVGQWYVATRVAGDDDTTVRIMGGYATPAALIDALAGKVIFAEGVEP